MQAASAPRRTILWVILIATAALLYGRGLADYQIDDDEEGYAYAAWRTSQMDVPYRDFLTPQLPAFLYPAAVVMRIAGRDLEALRAWSVLLVLAAGAAVFYTGRSLLGSLGGLLAAAFFLAAADVFSVGRAFRPEATMLAATTAAMAVLVAAEARRSRAVANRGPEASGATGAGTGIAVTVGPEALTSRRARAAFAAASLLFAIGLLAKLFAALPWAAAVAYVGWEAIRRRRTVRASVGDGALLVVPGLLLVGLVMGAFVLVWPETLDAVLGHHLRQGAGLGWSAVAVKTLHFFRSALERNAILLVFVPAGIAGLLAVGGSRAGLVVWQLPTVLAFFFLTRDLYHRHLVVLFPAVALCAAGALVWFARAAGQSRLAVLATASVAGALFLALATVSLGSVRSSELATAAVGALSRALVEPGHSLVSDTAGPAFHAGRTTTRTAAGLSAGAALSGQITGAELLAEMDNAGGSRLPTGLPPMNASSSDPEGRRGAVDLILLDASPAAGHLRMLHDYGSFAFALTGGATASDSSAPGVGREGVGREGFERVGFARRSDLTYDVLRPRGAFTAALGGGLELLGARADADGELPPRRAGARPAVLVQTRAADECPGTAVGAGTGTVPVDVAWLRRASPLAGSAAVAGDGLPATLRWRVECVCAPATLSAVQVHKVCAEGSSPLVDVTGRAPGDWEPGEVVGGSYRLVLPDRVREPYRIQMAPEGAGAPSAAWSDVE